MLIIILNDDEGVMERTLVYKASYSFNGDDKGTVIPVAIEKDDGVVVPVDISNYPNNSRIFISKEYEKIHSSFADGELFVLTDVKEADVEEYSDAPNRSRYYSMGYFSAHVETNTYLPIVQMDLPDIASGRVEHGPSIDVGSKPFFILNNDIVSGPFVSQSDEDTYLITPLQSVTPLSLSTYYVAQFLLRDLVNAGLILRTSGGGVDRIYFTSLKRAKEQVTYDLQDYISDAALIRLFAKNDFGRGVGSLTKTEATKLANLINAYRKKNKITTDSDRTTRLESVLSEYVEFEGVGNDIVTNYLNTKVGKAFLAGFVEDHKEQLLKETIKTIEDREEIRREKAERETADVISKLEVKKSELRQLEEGYERRKIEAQERIEKLNSKSREEEEVKLKDRNKQIVTEIETNEKLLGDLRSALGEYKDIKSRKDEITKLDNISDYKRDELNRLRQLVEEQQNFITNPKMASQKMVEIDMVKKLLSGSSHGEEQEEVFPLLLVEYPQSVEGDKRKDYINNLKDDFSKGDGRSYSYDEMANLVVTVMQSYFTIIAGPPGTGKTSTINRFAEAMGLVHSKKSSIEMDNFLSVSVARGWTSSRELLGFFNSLKNAYQPSRSGLFQFLSAFSKQAKSGIDYVDGLKLVLLDEANLSSIEHYWSDFLLICDYFEKSQKIDLGMSSAKGRYLDLPNSLRFIGTINNDSTVEGLSSRLIDRAAIINLGYESFASTSRIADSVLRGAVPYEQLRSAFTPGEDEDYYLDFADAVRLKQVLDILSTSTIKGGQIHFSKRKTNAISRYCFIANQLSYEKSQPLDYAISQHILPAVSGHGPGLRERLKQLEVKLDEFDYSISRKLVSGIIESGDDYSDSYSFF